MQQTGQRVFVTHIGRCQRGAVRDNDDGIHDGALEHRCGMDMLLQPDQHPCILQAAAAQDLAQLVTPYHLNQNND